MMIYRVILKVSYYEAFYDFQDIQSAADFVVLALSHQTTNEDTKKKRSISIVVIDPSIEEEEDDE